MTKTEEKKLKDFFKLLERERSDYEEKEKSTPDGEDDKVWYNGIAWGYVKAKLHIRDAFPKIDFDKGD